MSPWDVIRDALTKYKINVIDLQIAPRIQS